MPSRATGTSPEDGLPTSSFKYTPFMQVRTLFAQFLQGLFYAAPHGHYHWDPDPQISEIYISNENPVNGDTLGQRPAMTFTRGPASFYSLGLDDMLGFDFESGAKKKSVLVPGTMSVNCCSRNDLESENLAWIVAEQLWLHRELLMQAGFFEIGRQPVIGAPSQAGSLVAGDSATEWYVTTVACPYQFYRTSEVTPLGKKIIRDISINLSTRSPNFLPQGPVAQGHEIPLNIHNCPPPPYAPAASDAHGGSPNPAGDSSANLPLVPHPLNPAQKVVVRSVHPYRPGLRPPSLGGRTIPLSRPCVEESNPRVTGTSKLKV